MEVDKFRYVGEDILFKEILTKLPVKSLTRFKSVSKAWWDRISSHSFMADHATAQKLSDLCCVPKIYDHDFTRLFLIPHGEFNLVEIDLSYVTKTRNIEDWVLNGSSNGLVLIQLFYRSDGDEHLMIWNPATRDASNLPRHIVSTPATYYECSLGFGNDCHDYKVVRIAGYDDDDDDVESTLGVQLFSRNSGRWRELGSVSGRDLVSEIEGGVEVDGFIYWAIVIRDSTATVKGSQYKILSVDLNIEELKEMDGPVSQSNSYFVHFELVKWRASLAALVTKDGGEREFWVKFNPFCWNKVSVIEPPVSTWRLRGVFRNKFLLTDKQSKQLHYDPLTRKQMLVFEHNATVDFGNYFYHFLYLPTLISPTYNV